MTSRSGNLRYLLEKWYRQERNRGLRGIDLPELIPRSERIKEGCLEHLSFTEFKEITVYRWLGSAICRHIVPGASGDLDVQDAVEHIENTLVSFLLGGPSTFLWAVGSLRIG